MMFNVFIDKIRKNVYIFCIDTFFFSFVNVVHQ